MTQLGETQEVKLRRVYVVVRVDALIVYLVLNLAILCKEHTYACAMVIMLKTAKANFDFGHAWLLEVLETLDKTYKVLESVVSSPFKSLDQSQSYHLFNLSRMFSVIGH